MLPSLQEAVDFLLFLLPFTGQPTVVLALVYQGLCLNNLVSLSQVGHHAGRGHDEPAQPRCRLGGGGTGVCPCYLGRLPECLLSCFKADCVAAALPAPTILLQDVVARSSVPSGTLGRRRADDPAIAMTSKLWK